MPYLGNNLEAAFKNYKSIDDISSSFNGSTTSFALQVNSLTPVPFPRDSQNCLISVGGVIQKPDATGTTGFKLSGTNIVFSSAPAIGESFFGIILAGADYVNAGVNYPDGTAGAPSITWSDDTDTGFYRSGAGTTSATANGNQVLEFASSTSGNFSVLSDLKLNDSKKIKIGTSDDLQIYHDGTYNTFAGANFLVRNAAANETLIYAVEDGASELWYDNSKKFETYASGVKATGNIYTTSGDISCASDSHKLTAGASDDLKIYHNGSHNYITNAASQVLYFHGDDFSFKNAAADETLLSFSNGYGVNLYYDNVKKLETQTGGVKVIGTLRLDDGDTTTNRLVLGTGGDFLLFHDGSTNVIDCYSNLEIRHGAEKMIACAADGQVELYHDNEKKVTTSSSGLEIYGTDGGAATLDLRADEGAHGADMFRFHVDDGGPLYIKNYEAGAWENNVMIEGNDGGVHLYYDNTKVFQTGPNPSNVRVSAYFEAFWDVSDAEYVYNGSGYPFHKAQTSIANWTMSCENSNNTAPYGFLIKYSDAAPDNNTEQAILFADSGASRFIVYSDGDAWTSDAGTLTSDETLKENITDATSKLEDIKKLKVRNFNWKASFHPEKSKKKQIGFIAQEVEEVFPSLVNEYDISPDAADKDHTPVMKKAIKAAWDPIIIKAMQELITKVETLETKVAALESA